MPELREVHLGDWDGGGEHRIRVANRDPIAVQSFRDERWDVLPGAADQPDEGGEEARPAAYRRPDVGERLSADELEEDLGQDPARS